MKSNVIRRCAALTGGRKGSTSKCATSRCFFRALSGSDLCTVHAKREAIGKTIRRDVEERYDANPR